MKLSYQTIALPLLAVFLFYMGRWSNYAPLTPSTPAEAPATPPLLEKTQTAPSDQTTPAKALNSHESRKPTAALSAKEEFQDLAGDWIEPDSNESVRVHLQLQQEKILLNYQISIPELLNVSGISDEAALQSHEGQTIIALGSEARLRITQKTTEQLWAELEVKESNQWESKESLHLLKR